ncbi:hypothetical protein B4U79_09178 [Dinothrombium tinctorium]|uniref:DOMON domain-containing protein n=1 Tax=Dinothrombium tinctorium TaxID=1965070 RepID=A0A3S3PMK7_9ACAR|nr:hypothetical protein B4U79_09178 [Dinothrombium tinctorium]
MSLLDSPCRGEWRYPQGCEGYGCNYVLTWEYIDETDDIMFIVSTKHRNKWTGVGFSADKLMPQSDAVLGLFEETGRFFLMDTWLKGYEVPPLDQIQNLHNMSAWRENGITNLRFFRQRQTGDKYDFQFTDDNCPYLMFPVEGGLFNAVNKRIRQHEGTPIVSENRICIKSCKVTKSKIETTPKPKSEPEESSAKKETVSAQAISPVKHSPVKENEPSTSVSVLTTEKVSDIKNVRDDMSNSDESYAESDSDSDAKNIEHKQMHTEEAVETATKSVNKNAITVPTVISTELTSTTEKELSSPKTKSNTFYFDIKLLNIWKASLDLKNGTEFLDLKRSVADQVKRDLESEFDLDSVETVDINGEDEAQNAIATIKIELDDDDEVDPKSNEFVPLKLKDAISAMVADNKIGNLTVDPNFISFKNLGECVCADFRRVLS